MRVNHNGITFKIGNAQSKKILAGEYETNDITEIELLNALADANAVTVLPN